LHFFFARQKTHGGFATIVAKMHFCNHGYILHSKMLQSSEGRMLCEAKIVPMACGHDAIEDQLRGAPCVQSRLVKALEAVKTLHFLK